MPKLNPWIQDYIESKFVADFGLGIFIYILSLFVIINIGKAISKAVTYSGLGTVDKTFGILLELVVGVASLIKSSPIFLAGIQNSWSSSGGRSTTINQSTPELFD